MGADERHDDVAPRLSRLAITATRMPGEAVVLSLDGELDIASCPVAADEIAAWRGAEPELRLDLSNISFIDSQGLHLLLDLTAPDGDGGGPVVLLAPSETVMQVIEVTGTAQRLGVSA